MFVKLRCKECDRLLGEIEVEKLEWQVTWNAIELRKAMKELRISLCKDCIDGGMDEALDLRCLQCEALAEEEVDDKIAAGIKEDREERVEEQEEQRRERQQLVKEQAELASDKVTFDDIVTCRVADEREELESKMQAEVDEMRDAVDAMTDRCEALTIEIGDCLREYRDEKQEEVRKMLTQKRLKSEKLLQERLRKLKVEVEQTKEELSKIRKSKWKPLG